MARRYSEGTEPQPLVLPEPRTNIASRTAINNLQYNRRNTWYVPPGLPLSGTSDALECFVNRKNSERFQKFMLNYAYVLCTTKVLSGEV